MAKIWRVLLTIVGIVLLLGAVCVLVGIITGGSFERIKMLFDTYFDIPALVDAAELKLKDLTELASKLLQSLK